MALCNVCKQNKLSPQSKSGRCKSCQKEYRRQYTKNYLKKWRQKRLAVGYCGSCFKNKVEDGGICQVCSMQYKKYYTTLTDIGLCVDCKTPTTYGVRCRKCSKKHAAAKNAVIQERRRRGVCIKCEGKLSRKSKSYCWRHYQMERNRLRRQAREKKKLKKKTPK